MFKGRMILLLVIVAWFAVMPLCGVACAQDDDDGGAADSGGGADMGGDTGGDVGGDVSDAGGDADVPADSAVDSTATPTDQTIEADSDHGAMVGEEVESAASTKSEADEISQTSAGSEASVGVVGYEERSVRSTTHTNTTYVRDNSSGVVGAAVVGGIVGASVVPVVRTPTVTKVKYVPVPDRKTSTTNIVKPVVVEKSVPQVVRDTVVVSAGAKDQDKVNDEKRDKDQDTAKDKKQVGKTIRKYKTEKNAVIPEPEIKK